MTQAPPPQNPPQNPTPTLQQQWNQIPQTPPQPPRTPAATSGIVKEVETAVKDATTVLGLVKQQPSILAFIPAILGVICATVLIAMSKTVPQELWLLTGGSGLGGLTALSPKA